MDEYSYAIATRTDRPAILSFMRTHWETLHPLVELEDFFEYYYRGPGNRLNFALCHQNGKLAALAGFIPANSLPKPDLWVSLWVADPAAKGSGLQLMAALPKLTGCRTLACNNIRPKTRPFYEFLGYTTGQLGHFYRLANRPQYRLARVEHRTIPPISGKLHLAPLPTPASLKASGFVPPKHANPYKDIDYIIKRYYHFPRQSYRLYAVASPAGGPPQALLATRLSRVNDTAALRIVDYLGPQNLLPGIGPAIQGLMDEADAEYADLYCAGIPPETLHATGFTLRTEADPNIIPNYLCPLQIENVDYYYFTSRPKGFTLFKADGDQDRPHIPLPSR